MDFLSELFLDTRSHMDVLGCISFAYSSFWLVLQTPDILAVTGVISNKSFSYTSFLITPLNFSCTTDDSEFAVVDVYMPAYKCTNVSGDGIYLDDAMQVNRATFSAHTQVEVMIGTGAEDCQDPALSLCPYLFVTLLLLAYCVTT